MYLSNDLDGVYIYSTLSVFLFAFIQVALLEESSKWFAFKSGDIIRGRNALRDHPYAIMFYTAMVAAGFAAIENTEYAIRAIRGGFGPDVSAVDVLIVRSLSSVILHMVCGVILGYYIALGAKSNLSDKIKFNIIGLLFATALHGAYDFTLMHNKLSQLTIDVGFAKMHWPSFLLVIVGLILTYFMATDLKYRKIKKKKIK